MIQDLFNTELKQFTLINARFSLHYIWPR